MVSSDDGLDAHADAALLVEDEPTVAQLCAKLLSPWRMRTRVARSVAEAMAALEEGGPLTLACVDVGLPDGSGFDVVRALRARRPSVPILVVTGREISADATDARVLRKPFSPAQFQVAVDEVVRAQRPTS
jgi:DNA-binding response OmpR family regulator